jgi:hypothetical protein
LPVCLFTLGNSLFCEKKLLFCYVRIRKIISSSKVLVLEMPRFLVSKFNFSNLSGPGLIIPLAGPIIINLFPVQLSPTGVDAEESPEPTPIQQQAFVRAVGRFHIQPFPPASASTPTSTPTPASIPRQLSSQDELLEKCRERGLTPDRPALFGVRPVINPRVSQ